MEDKKELKFRLLDYRGFDVLHELLDTDNTDKMKCTKGTGGMNPNYRYIEIPKSNIPNFPLLKEVLDDLSTYQTSTNSSDSINFHFRFGISKLMIDNFVEAMNNNSSLSDDYFNNIDEIINLIRG